MGAKTPNIRYSKLLNRIRISKNGWGHKKYKEKRALIKECTFNK